MNSRIFSKPLSLKSVQIEDSFWEKKAELVRTEMIPYQWAALNDKVEGAAPSFCMRNFRVAGQQNCRRKEEGERFTEPLYTFRGFEVLPEDPKHLEDQFYGFVFQDSDLYKWLEAVSYSLIQHPDAHLEALADEAIDLICGAQQEDGYLDTYYILTGKDQIFSNLRDHHELYCMGHLIEGAVAYYEATGKDRLLKAAARYADYAAAHLGYEDGKLKGYPGHEIAEMALVRLYEATGEEKYLELGRYFVDERGKRPYYFDKEHPEAVGKDPDGMRYEYHQAHVPVREQREAVGHAVRAVYLYSGMADIARLTDDDRLYEACESLWDNVERQKLYITGGIGGTHIGESFSYNYDLPNDTAYAETCASIGLVFWARRMLEIKPVSKYADVMERCLYNGVLSGMALDGKSFFYVNPLEVVPEACRKDERKAHVKSVRQKWFGCACCPPNLARMLSSLGAYAYTERDDTLFVHLYTGGSIQKQVNGEEIRIEIASGFPWDGKVKVKVDSEAAPFTLALRIPDWCGGRYTLKADENKKTEVKDGYLYVSGNWEKAEELEMEFAMEIQILEADPRVREDIGKCAVMRGPIVYCLEEVDNGADLHLLTINPDGPVRMEDAVIAGECVKKIVASGNRRLMPEAGQGLYTPAQRAKTEETELNLIPYYAWGNRGENEMMVWIRSE